MAALDDAARAAKALLAPDESILFRQMLASDVPMEDIAKRLGLLRKATRKGGDMGGAIEEVESSIKRLKELMRYVEANTRLSETRLNRGGVGGFLAPESATRRLLAAIMNNTRAGIDPVTGWRRKALETIGLAQKNVARNKDTIAREMSEISDRPMSFREALSKMGSVSPRLASSNRRTISYNTSKIGRAKAEAEMMDILRSLLGPLGE